MPHPIKELKQKRKDRGVIGQVKELAGELLQKTALLKQLQVCGYGGCTAVLLHARELQSTATLQAQHNNRVPAVHVQRPTGLRQQLLGQLLELSHRVIISQTKQESRLFGKHSAPWLRANVLCNSPSGLI